MRAARRGDFAFYTFGETDDGLFNIKAAELFLKLTPRTAQRVTPRQLDAYFWRDEWRVNERHLKHVDLSAPGIYATMKRDGHKNLVLIEGFHRAERHRRERTEWSCFVLTFEETCAILTPHNLVKPRKKGE